MQLSLKLLNSQGLHYEVSPDRCDVKFYLFIRIFAVLPDPAATEGARRSKRTRVAGLRWHENERIKYERRKSGGWVIAGVVPPLIDEVRREEAKKKKERQTKGRLFCYNCE